jgi:hypothetical protein
MNTLVAYIKATFKYIPKMSTDLGPFYLVYDTCSITLQGGPKISYCIPCAREMSVFMKVPFTLADVCSLGPLKKGVCVLCMRPQDHSVNDIHCSAYPFDGLCRQCHIHAADVRRDLVTKRLLLGTLVLPELAAAIIGTIGSLAHAARV